MKKQKKVSLKNQLKSAQLEAQIQKESRWKAEEKLSQIDNLFGKNDFYSSNVTTMDKIISLKRDLSKMETSNDCLFSENRKLWHLLRVYSNDKTLTAEETNLQIPPKFHKPTF